MPRFAHSVHARVGIASLVVALLSASAAVAVQANDAPPPRRAAIVPAVAHDGLADQLALAIAFDERLAALRAAARVPVAEPPRPVPPPTPSRAAARPRPTIAPAPPPPPVVRSPMGGPIVWPAAGAVTGTFGEPRGKARHPGIDIDGETGDPVWAATKGVVSWAGNSPAGYSGYGIMVLIDHGDGVQTLYAHLSSLTVATGASVDAGVQVGRIGSTGHSTGSHLHFEVRRDGVATDPAAFLPPR